MKSIFGLKSSSYLLLATSDVGMHFHEHIKKAVIYRYFVVFYEFCYLYDSKGFSKFLCGHAHQAHTSLPRWQLGKVHRTMSI